MDGRVGNSIPREASATSARRFWWSGRALSLHVALAVALPLFAVAFVWQVDRVRQGNELSWAYVFEWPFFAAYAVYLWWKLLHDQVPRPVAPAECGPSASPAQAETTPDPDGKSTVEPDAEEDEELAAYNSYLAELNASGRRKHW